MNNMFSLEGKIALVTGASYGIGFAIATAMADAGATIVFNDIKQELVDKGLALRAGAAGLAAAALSAWLAGGLDGTLLRKAFGVFTMVVGLRELFCKSGRQD